jgi:CheY-like chemotaxis protein
MISSMGGTPDATGERRGRGPADVLIDPRVLVVDDNQAIHDDVRKILDLRSNCEGHPETMQGEARDAASFVQFQIDSAFQGEEALGRVIQALAEERPYAVAFVDVRMPPGWDGVETIRRIWNEEPDVQVVICTAFADHWPEIVAELAPSDGLLILRKPFDGIEVRQMVYALSAKWMLNRELHIRLGDLERGVQRRTRELFGHTARSLGHAFEDLGRLIDSYRRIILEMSAPSEQAALLREIERADEAGNLHWWKREVPRALDRLAGSAQAAAEPPDRKAVREQTDEHPAEPLATASARR